MKYLKSSNWALQRRTFLSLWVGEQVQVQAEAGWVSHYQSVFRKKKSKQLKDNWANRDGRASNWLFYFFISLYISVTEVSRFFWCTTENKSFCCQRKVSSTFGAPLAHTEQQQKWWTRQEEARDAVTIGGFSGPRVQKWKWIIEGRCTNNTQTS